MSSQGAVTVPLPWGRGEGLAACGASPGGLEQGWQVVGAQGGSRAGVWAGEDKAQEEDGAASSEPFPRCRAQAGVGRSGGVALGGDLGWEGSLQRGSESGGAGGHLGTRSRGAWVWGAFGEVEIWEQRAQGGSPLAHPGPGRGLGSETLDREAEVEAEPHQAIVGQV